MNTIKKLLCVSLLLCLLATVFSSCAMLSGDDDTNGLEFTLSSDETYYIVSASEKFDSTTLTVPGFYKDLPVKAIAEDGFADQTQLTSVTLPDGMTKIGKYAFKGCTGLTKINMPSYLEEIGSYAFHNCSSLTKVTIPSSVTTVGGGIFEKCSADIVMEDPSVLDIWGTEWNGSTGALLTKSGEPIDEDSETTKPSTNTSANNNGNTSTDTSASTTLTYSTGFTWEEHTGSADRGVSITGMGTCKDTVVVIPPTLKMPNGTDMPVVSIKTEAFKQKANKITAIVVPDSVIAIGPRAFMGCTALESITVPFIGKSISSSYPIGFWFSNTEGTGLTAVSQQTNLGYNASLKNETYYIPSSLRSVTITKDSIGFGALSSCPMITSVTLSSNCQSIGDRAFSNCEGLTSIAIPASVKNIYEYAFSYCKNLETITFANTGTTAALKSIGMDAFTGCEKLKSITIPRSVTTIGDGAFSRCKSLTSIVIPASVTSMGYEVIDNNCTALTNIYVCTTQSGTRNWDEDWNDHKTAKVTYGYSG